MSRYALYQPDNRIKYSEAFSHWSMGAMTVADSVGQVAPDGTATAKKIMEDASSANHVLAHAADLSNSGDWVGHPVWCEFYWLPGEKTRGSIYFEENAGSYRSPLYVGFDIETNSAFANPGYIHTNEVTSFGWHHIIAVSSFTIRAHSGFAVYWHGRDAVWSSIYQGTSGSGFYVWHLRAGPFEAPYAATTSPALIGDAVLFEPSWDTVLGRQRFIEENRTSFGRRSVYPWGDKQRFEFPVEQLRGKDGLRINSWWASADSLNLKNVDSLFSAPLGVFIAGNNPPLAPMKVYDAEWGGVIKLEEY